MDQIGMTYPRPFLVTITFVVVAAPALVDAAWLGVRQSAIPPVALA